MNCRRITVVFSLKICALALVPRFAAGQQVQSQQPAASAASQPGEKMQPATPAVAPKKTQSELEADLAKMLSGATLEGSFNTTGAGRDATRISADKYTLGE